MLKMFNLIGYKINLKLFLQQNIYVKCHVGIRLLVYFHAWYFVWHVLYDRHYGDVIMDAIASRITSLTIVYSTVYSDADQRKQQSSASLAFLRGIHRGPANSSHKWPVTRKMFPFDDVIMDLKTWSLSLKSELHLNGQYMRSLIHWLWYLINIACQDHQIQ